MPRAHKDLVVIQVLKDPWDHKGVPVLEEHRAQPGLKARKVTKASRVMEQYFITVHMTTIRKDCVK